jgi:uncharacterized membrane protein YkvA (DUF1232 family)
MADRRRADLLLEGILHPGEVDRFVAVARPTIAAELPGLRERVLAHLREVESLAAEQPRVDVDTARRISEVLAQLCEQPELFDDQHRALLRGAVEYFVLDHDVRGDTTDVLGFDDDARVVNAVTASLGRPDLRIAL